MAELSVIIPVYKVEKYLRRCLDSVVEQTFRDLEIILIDDGSPDGCGEICDKYKQKDDRIKVIHKENEGLIAARNEGIKTATGNYIAFVDSDDWLETDTYERAMEAVWKDTPDVLLFNYYRNTQKSQTKVALSFHEFMTESREDIRKFQMAVVCRFMNETKQLGYGYPWNRIMNRSFILENNLFFANVHAYEDIIYGVSVFQYAKKVSYIDIYGYHYCFNQDSITNKYTYNRIEVDREVWEQLFQLGREYELGYEYYDGVNAMIVNTLILCLDRCIFHKDNPMKLFEKIKVLKEMIDSEPYRTACLEAKIKYVEKRAWPIMIFRKHNVWLIYTIHCLRQVKKRFVQRRIGNG